MIGGVFRGFFTNAAKRKELGSIKPIRSDEFETKYGDALSRSSLAR
jgi:hypothetical protein